MPIYRPDGRITAATASGQADGAAVCLVMSRERAAALGLTPLARIHTIATGACAPTRSDLLGDSGDAPGARALRAGHARSRI